MTRTFTLLMLAVAATTGCIERQDFGTDTNTTPKGGNGGAFPPSTVSSEGTSPSLIPCPTGPLCWVNPSPTGDEYRSIWASADDDLWLVTQSGTVVRGDGTSFRVVYQAEAPVRSALIAGSSDDDVWVVLNEAGGTSGAAAVGTHWDGTNWSEPSEPFLGAEGTAVTVLSATAGPAFIVVGADGEVAQLALSGGQYVQLAEGPVQSIAAATTTTPAVDVFLAQSDATPPVTSTWVMLEGGHVALLESTGRTWQDIPPDPADQGPIVSLGLSGTSDHDVWSLYEAATSAGVTTVFRHFDGTSWTTFDRQTTTLSSASYIPTFHSRRVSGNASTIWVSGRQSQLAYVWNGSVWSSVPAPTFWTQAFVPFGSESSVVPPAGCGTPFVTPTSAWFAGPAGVIYRGNDAAWVQVAGAPAPSSGSPPLGSSVVWSPTTNAIAAISAPADNDVWTLGLWPSSIVQRFDGTTWHTLPAFPAVGTGYYLDYPTALVVFGADDAWVGGMTGLGQLTGGIEETQLPLLAHWNGSSWQRATTPPVPASIVSPWLLPMGALWGHTSDNVWAAPGTGGLLHWNGSSWSASVQLPAPAAGTLMGFQGATPVAMVTSITGTAVNDVWFAGYWVPATTGLPSSGPGLLFHWDGARFSDSSATLPVPMGTIFAPQTGELWGLYGADSQDAEVFHWTGSEWQLIPTGSVDDAGYEPLITGVWGSGPDDVWFVGSRYATSGAEGSVTGFSGDLTARSALFHWNGGELNESLVPVAGPALSVVTGSGPGDMWTAGVSSAVMRTSLDGPATSTP